ncbi:MAG: methyl-accepting chemotaxis protein [Betaproteobacteria bacterium]|nr:methyl-accepting chemotaxis protein [Betaproteobacteria bacterium]
MSLKQRLLVFVATLLAIVIAVLTSIAYWQMRVEIINDVNKKVESTVIANSKLLAGWIAQRRDAIEAVTVRLASANDPVPFLIAGKDAGRFFQTYVGYEDKRMIYHLVEKKPIIGYDPTSRLWYKQANEEKGTIVTPPYIFASTNALGITVAQSVDSRVRSVVGGDIELTEIIQLVNSIELHGQGYAFLVTRDGKIVAHSKPDSALKPVAEIMPGFDESILKTAGVKILPHEFSIEGVPKYVTASPVSGSDWVLCIVIDKTTVLSPLRFLLWGLVLAGLVIALLGVPIANRVLSQLLHGLFKLQDALIEVASGRGELMHELAANTHDEIGQTAAVFDRFIEDLRGMFVEVRERASALNGDIYSLNGMARTIADKSKYQSEKLDFMVSAIKKMTASIDDIADSALQMEWTVKQLGITHAASQPVASEIQGIQGEIDRIAASMREIATTMRKQSIVTHSMVLSAEEVNLINQETNRCIHAATETVFDLSKVSGYLYGVIGRFPL